MRKMLFISICLLSNFVFAQDGTKKIFDFRISSNIEAASSRYNHESKEIVDDTLHYYNDSTGYMESHLYTTDLNQQRINISVGFLAIKNLSIYLNVPLVNSSVTETFRYDTSITTRWDRNDESKTYIEGAALSASCFLINGKVFSTEISGSVGFPFHDYKFTIDSTTDPINNKKITISNFMEYNVGASIGLKLSSVSFNVGAVYNFGNNDFSDMLHLNAGIAISTIPNTKLYTNVDYATAMSEFNPETQSVSFHRIHTSLYTNKITQPWERHLDAGIGFKINFTEYIYADVGYDIRLWGDNALGSKLININLGYIMLK